MDLTKKQILCFSFLLCMILALNILSSLGKSLTYDEPSHHKYGLQILNMNSDRFDDSKMPISALNSLPYWIGQKLSNGDLKTLLLNVEAGRIFTMLFSVLLGFYVFRWSGELYGITAAFFSLILYVFDPNILAHSRLITTDLFAAFGLTVSCYYFYRFLKDPNWKTGLWAASAVGFSQLLKYSCVFLYPLLLAMTIIFSWERMSKAVQSDDKAQLVFCLKTFAGYALMFIVVSILIINAGFLFNKTFTQLKNYSFRSQMFLDLQRIPGMRDLPVPVPYPYLDGLDQIRYRERTGYGYGSIYLFGKLRSGKGFPDYYVAASLLKVPLATLLIFLLAITRFVLKHREYDFKKNESFLFVPIVFFAIYLNLFFRAQMGIRFFIIIFPLVFVFCGSLFREWIKNSYKIKACALAMIFCLIVSVISYFPHYISYFNELVPDRKMAYKYLADSNLDWGQNRTVLKRYLKENPDIIWSPDDIVAGRIMVDTNYLVGIGSPEKYRWLRENFEPVDQLFYAYPIFEIPEEALDLLKAKYR
jgi:hypothetical protein